MGVKENVVGKCEKNVRCIFNHFVLFLIPKTALTHWYTRINIEQEQMWDILKYDFV